MSAGNIDESAIERLLKVIGGDRNDLLELLEEFLVLAPDALRKMEEAAETGDLGALRISSHSLKSNSRDFGLVVLADICDSLERACKEGSVDDAPRRVAAASEAFASASIALRALVTGHE